MFKFSFIITILFCLNIINIFSQVENVTVSNPVYDYLIHAESLGLLPHFSSSYLPLPRSEIINALKEIREKSKNLSSNELNTLERFEQEFSIKHAETRVVIFSESDSTSIFWSGFIENNEKLIYKYRDSINSISIVPLGSVEAMFSNSESKTRNVQLGTLGVRLYGTIYNCFGYYLQATNGVVLGGERTLAKEDIKLRQNVKFAELNSDIDFTESHIRFAQAWFYASLGRETRLLGSGLVQRMYISANAPPFDAISLGAKFKTFEYNFIFGDLVSFYKDSLDHGFNAVLPAKYLSMHRFTVKPSYGEFSFWESVVFSNRNISLAYLNPLSFIKSLEHALHDRDNTLMGADVTIRPFQNISIKGSFILDDIIFSKIGKSYWGNKAASNIGLIFAFPYGLDIGAEYSRIEPYTFSHFNYINSYTNDRFLIGSDLLPNSDKTSLILNYWWGNRYPISLEFSYMRHGDNIYDNNGNLIFNAGADPFQSIRPEDSETVSFLGGRRDDSFIMQLIAGLEIVRGFNLHGLYQFQINNEKVINNFRLVFRFEDF